MFSAKRLDVLCFINKEKFSLPLYQYRSGCEANLVSALARNQFEASQFKCANTSSTARTRSRCAIFSKTEGTVSSIFPGLRSQALEDLRKSFGNGGEHQQYGGEMSNCSTVRTELSLQALHAEECFATTKSRICWTTSALDRIGSGNRNIVRNV